MDIIKKGEAICTDDFSHSMMAAQRAIPYQVASQQSPTLFHRKLKILFHLPF